MGQGQSQQAKKGKSTPATQLASPNVVDTASANTANANMPFVRLRSNLLMS